MDIQTEKLELMKMILETNNPNIIKTIRKIFKLAAKKDFWETLPQNQKDEILQGIKEIENGEIVDYQDFIKEYK